MASRERAALVAGRLEPDDVATYAVVCIKKAACNKQAAFFELYIWSYTLSISKISSELEFSDPKESLITRRKQEDICGFGVPALKSVGVA